MRHGGGGCVAPSVIHQKGHVVGREDLDRRDPGRLGEPVGVAAQEQWTVVALCFAVVADRLGGRHNVSFVERVAQAAAAVSRRPEGHSLLRVGGVGNARVVRRYEMGDIDEVAR